MYNISDNSLDNLLYKAAYLLKNSGNKIAQNGTTEILGVSFELTNPKNRWIINKERKHNVITQLAETIWVLSGSNDITWLNRYLKRAENFSDDKKTWRAGYGTRWRYFKGLDDSSNSVIIDQIKYVIDTLKKDLKSRQAVISVWDPAKEATIDKTLDMPCNDMQQFIVRDNKLYMFNYVRSNDLIWGFCLTGDTKVKLLFNKSKTMKELTEDYNNGIQNLVYSWDLIKGWIPGKIEKAAKTKTVTKLAYIYLDNGNLVKCTPEHKILMIDGSYKEAKDLKEKDSLMPVYLIEFISKYNKNLKYIFDANLNTYVSVDKIISEYSMYLDEYKLNFPQNYYENNFELSSQEILNQDHLSYKVISLKIEIIKPTDVYDLNISNKENAHNFALDSGIVVHNSGINVVEMTILQECIASILNVNLGSYNHVVTSLHYYDRHDLRINKIIKYGEEHIKDFISNNLDNNLPDFKINNFEGFNTLFKIDNLLSNGKDNILAISLLKSFLEDENYNIEFKYTFILPILSRFKSEIFSILNKDFINLIHKDLHFNIKNQLL